MPEKKVIPKTQIKRRAKTAPEKAALKERVRSMKASLDAPKYIGGEEELIPFSWRFPLTPLEDKRKMTKVYREALELEKALAFRDK